MYLQYLNYGEDIYQSKKIYLWIVKNTYECVVN